MNCENKLMTSTKKHWLYLSKPSCPQFGKHTFNNYKIVFDNAKPFYVYLIGVSFNTGYF